MARVFVGMSGGVDSSAAALLLRRQGHSVEGIHLRLLEGLHLPEGSASPAAEDARVHSLRAQEELGEIQGQRQDILEKAQREAEDILSDAQAQAGKLTEAAQAQHRETAEAARQEAEGILSDAQAQAQKLTQDAEAHIDRKWESFQENTQKLIAMHAELQSLLRRE